MKVTIVDIARRLGLSDSTVSRVLNNRENRFISEATITSFIPYEGKATIDMNQECKLRFRVSPSVKDTEIKVSRQGQPMETKREGVFWTVDRVNAGDMLEISFLLVAKTESFTVGNKGFQQYNFTAQWKGDTIVAMQADFK